MMNYKRADRVAALIKQEVSQIVLQEIKDPDIGFLTITKVKLSSDLKHAKIYYSVLGEAKKQEQAKNALDRSLKYIRSQVGHRINLRLVPTLEFFYDDSAAYADHIEQLLQKIKQEKSSL